MVASKCIIIIEYNKTLDMITFFKYLVHYSHNEIHPNEILSANFKCTPHVLHIYYFLPQRLCLYSQNSFILNYWSKLHQRHALSRKYTHIIEGAQSLCSPIFLAWKLVGQKPFVQTYLALFINNIISHKLSYIKFFGVHTNYLCYLGEKW